MRNLHLNKKNAFTLIEMAIVLAIVGLIGSIMMPIIINVVEHSKVESTRAQLLSLRNEIVGYFEIQRSLPRDLSPVGNPKDAWKKSIAYRNATNVSFENVCNASKKANISFLTVRSEDDRILADETLFFLGSSGEDYTQGWDWNSTDKTITLDPKSDNTTQDPESDDITQFITYDFFVKNVCNTQYENNIEGYVLYSKNKITNLKNSTITGNIFSKDDITIKKSHIDGDIHSQAHITIEANSTVNGVLIGNNITTNGTDGTTRIRGQMHANGTIKLKKDTVITGPIFASEDIKIYKNVKIDGDIHAGGSIRIKDQNVLIKGNIYSGSNAVIDQNATNATIEGDINSGGNSIIEAIAKIEGKIRSGQDVDIKSGTFNDDIDSNNDIYIRENSTVNGTITAAGKVEIMEDATVNGDIFAGDEITDNGDVNGTSKEISNPDPDQPIEQLSPSSIPSTITPIPQDFLPGTETLTVYGEETIAPDDEENYGNINIKNGGTLTFQADSCYEVSNSSCYTFEKFTADSNAGLKFDYTNGTNIVVFIKDTLNFDNNPELQLEFKINENDGWQKISDLSISDKKFIAKRTYWEIHGDHEQNINWNNQWLGTVYSVNSTVEIPSSFYGVGSFWTTGSGTSIKFLGDDTNIVYSLANFAQYNWQQP